MGSSTTISTERTFSEPWEVIRVTYTFILTEHHPQMYSAIKRQGPSEAECSQVYLLEFFPLRKKTNQPSSGTQW